MIYAFNFATHATFMLNPNTPTIIYHGFQPVVNENKKLVLAEFLPFRAKNCDKIGAAKLQKLNYIRLNFFLVFRFID